MKRILENSESSNSSGNEEEKGETVAKVAKTDNPTDHLVGVKVKIDQKMADGCPRLSKTKYTCHLFVVIWTQC